jgi:methionine transaminase
VLGLCEPGDEVLTFEPYYDSYAATVALASATLRTVALRPPSFDFDPDELRAAFSARTRVVLVNTPHNPTGAVFSREQLELIGELAAERDAVVVTDEVYEHMIFDGERHASILGHPELYERGVAVFSFGKTMHATGWRVGYTVAPEEITREIRRVHQFNTFSIAAPLQFAIADFLKVSPEHNSQLSAYYQQKRDRFLDCLRNSSFSWTPAAGTYFQLLDFSGVSQQSDVEFADTLLREAGVASIPVSVFYATPPKLSVLRFCFAKNDSTLEEAAERLCRV